MMDVASLHTETERVKVLRGYGVLDTPNEPEFDAIALKAKIALRVPIMLISLLDENRQWFKAQIGLNVTETPRGISFCTHALFGSAMLVIPDATRDDRFADNPLVTHAPYVRFYAGAALKAPSGARLGTLCAIDTRSRSGLSDAQIGLMTRLAAETIDAMERRRVDLAR
jgi:GAF domain-containing protein